MCKYGHCHNVESWIPPSWLPYSTYLYLDFHDKAKRTQQGDLLDSPPPQNFVSDILGNFYICGMHLASILGKFGPNEI